MFPATIPSQSEAPAAPLPTITISVDLLRASSRSDDFPAEITDQQRQTSIARYSMFLELCRRFPGRKIAPTLDIDRMWHLHMLAPVAYFKDCQANFGRILDHDGGFGKAPEEETALQAAFIDTAQLWEQVYSVPYMPDGRWAADLKMTNCWHDCSNRCWHACSNIEAHV